MIRKDFPQLREHCFEQRLDNGLLIRVIPRPGFAKRFAFLAADFGSNDTCFRFEGQMQTLPAGIAHYMEHKMFDMPGKSAMERFAEYGGGNNAFTNYNMTAYYVECTENFAENLTTLLEMVNTPYFTAESVEKERGIIAQEIKMYEDSAESAVFENLFAAMYHTHPIRVPIAGTVESIQDITPELLMTCHKAFYDPSNLFLCVVGDVDEKQVVELAKAHTPQSRGSAPKADYGPKEPSVPAQSRIEARMEVSMPTFAIGFKCPPPQSPEEEARLDLIGDLASELLAGESTELYQRLYEEGLIDNDFSSDFESAKGMCLLEASGDSDRPEAVLEALLAQREHIVREGLDGDLFLRTKKSLLGRRMRSLDSFEGLCYRICAHRFCGIEFFDYPAVFDTVTKEDVECFIRQNVIPERAAISIIYPKEDAT